MTNSTRIPNRLIDEKSPYLLQHAHNPVDWWPWRDEAFVKAREENKPVLLSVGYSTCHWCHVMAHESFEDNEIALILNRAFVCVKVDREERPDVDAVYMEAAMALTGGGGWPLTVLMTPERQPFFADTYLPKESRYGKVGLKELLLEVERLWRTERHKLLSAGERVKDYLVQREQRQQKPLDPAQTLYKEARAQFVSAFDEENGGFRAAPKFPMAHELLFLLELYALEGDEKALFMAEKTLTQMYRGGLYDHVGSGFSRYSTDEKWLVPHFEKMLYDNALLVLAYTEAYRLTGRPLYRRVAMETLDFCLNELLGGQGEFYCALDADSGGAEGGFYVFRPSEVQTLLGGEAPAFCESYDITEKGNFEGASILNLLKNPLYEETPARFRDARKTLYTYRRARMALHVDDKALTSWNALMIMALCRAGLIFDEPRYVRAALGAKQFIAKRLLSGETRLFARYRDGEAAFNGGLSDYAFYALALLSLYECTFDVHLLRDALSLAEAIQALFYDESGGGYFMYSHESERLLTRPKETFDGAFPSGNSAMTLLLQRLYKLTGQRRFLELFNAQLSFVCAAVRAYPTGHSLALLALLRAFSPSVELVCASHGGEAVSDVQRLLSGVGANNINALLKTENNASTLARLAPFTLAYPVEKGKALYYVCRNGSCRRPVFTVEEAAGLMGGTASFL